jgi:hypothetical protein
MIRRRNTTRELTELPPRRLARHLDHLATDALPCQGIQVQDGTPHDGLTVGLWIETHGRGDIRDLPRVLETEPAGHVTTAWSHLHPTRKHSHHRLLLHIQLTRPVKCDFDILFQPQDHPADAHRQAMPLLLAADAFAIGLDSYPQTERVSIWIAAPTTRDCIYDTLTAVGI